MKLIKFGSISETTHFAHIETHDGVVLELRLERILLADALNYINDAVASDPRITPPEGFSAWRPGQREVVKIAQSLHNNWLPVYIDAPTGSGKSVLALGIAAQREGTTAVLTADHQLQEQYAQYPQVKSITGRRNWTCSITGDNVEKAPCQVGLMRHHDCGHFQQDTCAYYLQAKQGMEADVCVTNYQYYLSSSLQRRMSSPICDEAHMIESITRDYLKVSAYRDENDFPAGDSHGEWLRFYVQWNKDLNELVQDMKYMEEKAATDDAKANYKQLIYRYNNELQKVGRMADYIMKGEKHIRQLDGKRLTVTPLLGRIQMVGVDPVLMSATLVDPTIADPRQLAIITMPSTFPKERRPVVPLNVVKLSRSSDDADYYTLARTIDNMMIKHGDTKGLIHTVSYDLADKIKAHSQFPEMMITHRPGDRQQAIDQFKAAPPGRVLLSPSSAQGLDLPYDECRWQMIAKMPFANLSDPVQKARSVHAPQHVAMDTARAVVQMAGRGMRAEDDQCVTYIADENWRWFYRQNSQLFPAWFREAIV